MEGGPDGDSTTEELVPITEDEKKQMDSVDNEHLLTGPMIMFSDDLGVADRTMIANTLARVRLFQAETCMCHKQPTHEPGYKMGEMHCACSKGGASKAMVDAISSNMTKEEAEARHAWCLENLGSCTDAEMAALEATIRHAILMEKMAHAQVGILKALAAKCDKLTKDGAPVWQIKKCLAAVAKMQRALGKYADIDAGASGSSCSNRLSPDKRFKLLVAEERLHNATMRLKREEVERYKLVSEAVASKMMATNELYKPIVTKMDLDKAQQQLEEATRAAKAAQTYYGILQENFASLLEVSKQEAASF